MKAFYIQAHFWLAILTASIFLEKGADAIVGELNTHDPGFPFMHDVPVESFSYVIDASLALLGFFGALTFCLRYLFWAPWPVFEFILDNSKGGHIAAADAVEVPGQTFVVAIAYSVLEWPLLVILLYNLGSIETFVLVASMVMVIDNGFARLIRAWGYILIRYSKWKIKRAANRAGKEIGAQLELLSNAKGQRAQLQKERDVAIAEAVRQASEKVESAVKEGEIWEGLGKGFYRGQVNFGWPNRIDFLFLLPGIISLLFPEGAASSVTSWVNAVGWGWMAGIARGWVEHLPATLLIATFIIVLIQKKAYVSAINVMLRIARPPPPEHGTPATPPPPVDGEPAIPLAQ